MLSTTARGSITTSVLHFRASFFYHYQKRGEGHVPVLVNASIDELDLENIEPNDKIIDCTFGAGGHTSLILG